MTRRAGVATLREAGGWGRIGADQPSRPDGAPVSGIREVSWFALGEAHGPRSTFGALYARACCFSSSGPATERMG
jgi:hypothetical protein